MPKYRKRPVVIEANQWFKNGDHPEDRTGELTYDHDGKSYYIREGKIVRYYNHPDVSYKKQCQYCNKIMGFHGWIDTLEGGHTVCPGDFIIKGIKGEFYPCKPDIFEQTYELVADEQNKKQTTLRDGSSSRTDKEIKESE